MLNESISLGKRQLVDTIWKSAGIEGLGTTFPNTEKILENLPVETTRDEVLFIVNMKRAFNFIFDNIDYPVNLMFLREVNKISMDNLIYNPGQIRNIPVSIGFGKNSNEFSCCAQSRTAPLTTRLKGRGGTSWRPEMPNEGIIIETLENISEISDPFDKAFSAFCFIARAQIFLDGNKRLAQLVCNKVLMEEDVGIFSVPYDKISNFKELLLDFYETNNSRQIKEFFKEECLTLSSKGYELLNRPKDNNDPDSDDFIGLGE